MTGVRWSTGSLTVCHCGEGYNLHARLGEAKQVNRCLKEPRNVCQCCDAVRLDSNLDDHEGWLQLNKTQARREIIGCFLPLRLLTHHLRDHHDLEAVGPARLEQTMPLPKPAAGQPVALIVRN